MIRRAVSRCVLTCLAMACGAKSPTVVPQVDPTVEVTVALGEAVKLIRERRFDEAERRLAASRGIAATDANELEKLDYYIATTMVYRGELQRAQQLIRAHAFSAASRGDVDSEAWMQSCSAWLRWAGHDHAGAIAENNRIAELAASQRDPMDRRALVLSQLWDRAFFLIDQAAAAPEGERATALARAREARDAYETLASDPENRDEVQFLLAYFYWRTGDNAQAMRSLDGIPHEHVDDVRSLYVMTVVLETAGQREAAARARSRLRSAVNLLAPLLERAVERIVTAAPPTGG